MSRPLDPTYFSPKVEQRPSAIEGRAGQQIKAGEVGVVKGGCILTKAQRDKAGKELGPAEIQVTEQLFVGPKTSRQREGGMMHLNFSSEPNLGLRGQSVFVVLEDIAQE